MVRLPVLLYVSMLYSNKIACYFFKGLKQNLCPEFKNIKTKETNS